MPTEAYRDLLTRHHRQFHNEKQDGLDGPSEHGSPDKALRPSTAHSSARNSPQSGTTLEQGRHLSPGLEEEVCVDAEASIIYRVPEMQGNTETSSERPRTTPTTTTGLESFGLSATPNFLIGATEGLQEFEFLWGDFPTDDQPLPITFFDTDLSLVDISQQYANLPPANRPISITSRECTAAINVDPPIDPNLAAEGTQSNPLVSRLPSLEPTGHDGASRLVPTTSTASYQPFSVSEQAPTVCPWRLSPGEYQDLSQRITSWASIIPRSFTLPSRHTLSRYLEGYFRGFHAHMPFLHTASLTPGALGPELVLSLAAVGALYRFEHAKGVELYRVARALINWRLDQLHEDTVSRLTSISPGYAGFTHLPGESSQHDPPSPILSQGQQGLRLLQGLLVLMAITSWGERALVRDALSMASQVATLVREFGISTTEDTSSRETSWEDWIRGEERRRTLFVAFVLFSLQCTAFNVPPMILNQEVRLNLPASAAEWKAQTAIEWSSIHSNAPWPPRPFQQALQQLLSGTPIHQEGSISAFGNYALIHGLFLQIFFARNALGPSSEGSLSTDFVKKMEAALRAWQESWEATHESTLDPSSPKGPLGFNSTALLRLVYIRLNANTGPYRQLFSRDPSVITRAFTDGKISVCKRSPHLDRAILQCIHALSVPVRVGIAFVARTLTLNWSFQHALSNLECAFLLTHWLRALAICVESGGIEVLRLDEQKLLNMVVTLVRETELAETLDSAGDHASRIRRLAASVVRLWAETFKGFQVFEIVYVVGQSLSMVADTLERE
ncbi:hypothetical protein ACJ41O_013099 [Fusarium nematophilum]